MNKKDYEKLVRSLGCLVCGQPAEIHHIRSMAGMGQKNSSWLIVPLCQEHHRTGRDAVHNNTRDERKYLSETIERVVQVLHGDRMPF